LQNENSELKSQMEDLKIKNDKYPKEIEYMLKLISDEKKRTEALEAEIKSLK
jgi:predicted  nucleic acid-binding Zn-ribbon protein